MAFKMDSGQLKIAEKLVILNDRSVGMLTRIYNIKKACADPKSKPSFLSDKSMESALKHIARKFPIVDTRSNSSTFSYTNTMKDDILKSLSLYYHTFADVLDLKDHVMQLLTNMDACQCQLDISLNYELTAGYLNLVVNLMCLMILLSRVEDRKAVLGLYNAAYDLTHNQSEPSFPRLGQMILDYENPLKKLSEDLGPLNRLIFSALTSLSSVYFRRNITADLWRDAQILSLTSNPGQIVYAAQTDTLPCEYLSLDVMDRWIVLCSTICHSSLLNDPTIGRLFQHALQMSLALRLFRDEIFMIHSPVQQFFDSIKGYHKKSQEVKDAYSIALQQSAVIHSDRRRYLRSALRELTLLLKDQPGLLGPKILFVWMGLSFSRDEVLWLLRHTDIWPSSTKKAFKQSDELADRQLPELIFYMVELRDLVRRFAHVIQRYYLQFVTGYDAVVLGEMIGQLQGLSEDDAQNISSFASDISNINSDTNMRALRLDWFRLQASVSMARSPFSLQQNKKLAILMNTTVFHLKMVDVLEEMLRETSDLSIYCFYVRLLERQLQACLAMPAQSRFVLSFARITAHFSSALHDMCPEEKNHLLEKSLALCNSVLDHFCQTVGEVVAALCEYECRLTEQTSAAQVAAQIVNQVQRNKGGKNVPPPREVVPAGEESLRIDRETLTVPDKLQTKLVELCAALTGLRQITVADHVFAPREYLTTYLENKFVEMIIERSTDGSSTPTPRRPSQLLAIINSFMTVIQNIDLSVSIDVHRIFNNALLQQTQPLDSKNKETVTSIYTKWYLEVVLRRSSTGHMLWSEHLQAMIASGDGSQFAPEQYTDPFELRCLAQVLGPYGVKYLSERLIWHVASQIGELNKIVSAHKEPLHIARTNFDSAERMKEVIQLLSHEPKENKKNPGSAASASDAILQRTSIIGQIFSFRDAVHSALRQVLDQRLPFMVDAFKNFYNSVGDEGKANLGELGAAMGQQCIVDAALANAVRAQNATLNPEEHYQLSCLLMVAVAISLPRLAQQELSIYKPSVQAALNNSHCIPIALPTMASALFHLHGRGDVHLRMKEFLALSSSSILRIAHDVDVHNEDTQRNHQFLYLLLDQIVKKSRWLSGDVLEACFPYNLIRTAYLQCYNQEMAYVNS